MRLMWRIFIPFFACALLALAVTLGVAGRSLRRFAQDQAAGELRTRASLAAGEVGARLAGGRPETVDAYCKEFGRLTQTRITVVLPDGSVLGDSEQAPSEMDNHGHRPEIEQALTGRASRAVRFSDTTRRTLLYLAAPVPETGAVHAAVRAAMPVSVVDWTIRSASRHAALGALAAAVFFAVAALGLARRISRPLDDMRRAAERLAQGDLDARAAPAPGPELQALARALNRMAEQLGERLATITRQRDEQKAVFASMAEGVLAVDGEGRVLNLNAAAARVLGLDAGRARGLSIQEAVRHPDLQRFVAETLAAGGPLESDIVLDDGGERFLSLCGAALADAAGKRIGALIVLHDVTRVRRLETVRRDFIANLSHELKTPITALRGCVETLAEAASSRPAGDEQRFLAMMDRQVARLGAIVEDLLSLSRLEYDAERRRIPLEPGPIADVLRRAAQAFAKLAEARGITVAVACPGDLSALINAPLLEQAVGNLVDNAIKYGPDRGRVTVDAAARGGAVEIRVADEGPGIEKKHLPRIFERFYRVDQARSRALGGTGLGLAIVKHIALAHGGSVAVDSVPGRGSVFALRLPPAPPA